MATVEGSETMTGQGVNGVDVAALFATMNAIQAQPELAQFQFRAWNQWQGGTHCQSRIKDFYGAGQEDSARTKTYVFDADEPPVLLGQDRGANPVEYVLHALAGCLTTSLVAHAAARGIRLHSVESRFEGDIDVRGFLGMDPGIRNGYREIRVTFKVKGDAPRETLEELVRVAQQRSPVFDIVSNPVPVKVELARD